LHFERVEIRVVGGLVIIEHKVDGIGRSADEDDLEDGVVECLALIEGPEEIDVSRHVYDEVEKLRLERDARRALLELDYALADV
jgi:hypothetical protein